MREEFEAYRDYKRDIREWFGIPCPQCAIEQPKRQPTILLPGHKCRVHKPHYNDLRPELTQDDINAMMREKYGLSQEDIDRRIADG